MPLSSILHRLKYILFCSFLIVSLADAITLTVCEQIDNVNIWQSQKELERKFYPINPTLELFLAVNRLIEEQESTLSLCRKKITQENNTGSKNRLLKQYANNWKNWIKLTRERELLIENLPEKIDDRYTGFGFKGVRQAKLELSMLVFGLAHAKFELLQGLKEFYEGLSISPAPLVFILIKLLLFSALYFWWRKKIVPVIRWLASKKTTSFHSIQFIARSYLKIQGPLESYIIILLIGSILNDTGDFILLNITYIILSWLFIILIIVKFLDGLAVDMKSRFNHNDELIRLRIKTIHWVSVGVFIYGLLISISNLVNLSNGAIAHWIKTFLIVAAIPMLSLLIHLWREIIVGSLNSKDQRESPIAKWVTKNDKGFMSFLATSIGAIYLLFQWILRFILTLAAGNEAIRIWLTYIFRIEVTRQHAHIQEANPLPPLPPEHTVALDLEYTDFEYIHGIYDHLESDVQKLWMQSKSSITLLYGALGCGKTTFAKHLLNSTEQHSKGYSCLYFSCPPGDFSDLMQEFTGVLELTDEGGTRELFSLLKEAQSSIICIDNVQHLVRPCINGLSELERLVRLIRRSSNHISWLLLIDTASWRFVERARGQRFFFDLEKEIPKWPEEKITELIDQRNDIENLEPDFSEIHLPRQLNEPKINDNELELRRYSRILWEYSKGNPGQALTLWKHSLYLDRENSKKKNKKHKALVRMFDTSDKVELEQLNITLLFTLRAILQLSSGSRDAIAKSTHLSIDEVIDALRLLITRGFIEKDNDNNYNVKWEWYQQIIQLLQRKHLLTI